MTRLKFGHAAASRGAAAEGRLQGRSGAALERVSVGLYRRTHCVSDGFRGFLLKFVNQTRFRLEGHHNTAPAPFGKNVYSVRYSAVPSNGGPPPPTREPRSFIRWVVCNSRELLTIRVLALQRPTAIELRHHDCSQGHCCHHHPALSHAIFAFRQVDACQQR